MTPQTLAHELALEVYDVLVAMGMLACLVPARRATFVDVFVAPPSGLSSSLTIRHSRHTFCSMTNRASNRLNNLNNRNSARRSG